MRNSDLPPIVTTERENQEDIEFMDTPIITQYYKEHDPMKRKELLGSPLQQESVPRRIRSVRNYGRSVMQSHPK